MSASIDQDALGAAVELVGRSGAREFELGYLYDDESPPPGWPEGAPVSPAAAAWYATVRYRGALLKAEGYPDPIGAAEALARRILDGATCKPCGRVVALGDGIAGACRWTRIGAHYVRGCDGGHGGRR